MALDFPSVFIHATGAFLPGEAIDNTQIDRFIAPLGSTSGRIKRRILADNGIVTRHYAIDEQGRTSHSAADMAARAVRACLADSSVGLDAVSVLCTGSSGGDLALPGFANMVQGELAAGPMHTSSHQGVCVSGVVALQHAASALALGEHEHALVVASELPSRMFKRSRFAPRGHATDFDSHFLRWMLSDGAGAMLLASKPRDDRPCLRLDWIHTRSFSGDHPVCMQIGSAQGGEHASYLDYASLADAERAGAFLLRQDIRLLPRLFELGIHEYLALIARGRIVPDEIAHLLCHYSSAKFAKVVDELMQKSGFAIPPQRWYSNLERRGNIGAASIFVMLDDFLRDKRLRPGERILCFVPESARFTVSFFQLTALEPANTAAARPAQRATDPQAIAAPHDVRSASTPAIGRLIVELASVWHAYQSRLRRTPLLRRLSRGEFTRADYLAWTSAWIPQVRSGSHWMRRAAERIGEPFEPLRALIGAHASDEQDDYELLYRDYQNAGGEQALEALRRNPGGEALHAFMSRMAERDNPVELLGAIYIIEGTGQRVIPQLLPELRRQLALPERCFGFLAYHGQNDASHLARWLSAVEIVIEHDREGRLREAIVEAARATAELYLLQFQYLTSEHG
jgi:3-oxoacyl-[acyl-carrier-protein] synthase III